MLRDTAHRIRGLVAREPLVLFLLGGALIFAVHALLGPQLDAGDNPRRISVSREDLVRFSQLRARVFSEEQAGGQFDAMSPAERKALLGRYLREEALYREALALGLDRQDYVVRRRIVQSLEFALGAEVGESAAPAEAAVRQWYADHPHLYALAPAITFSHVFFKGPDARARALAALAQLRAGKVDAEGLGDRFLYQRAYADRSAQEVASHFGPAMAEQLFGASPVNAWFGPVTSEHGLHLVRIGRRETGRLPPFELVRQQATQDFAEAERRAAIEKRVSAILAGYRVALASDLAGLR